jgi:hypothetical protein
MDDKKKDINKLIIYIKENRINERFKQWRRVPRLIP